MIYHSKNQGKGAALRSGFLAATGDIVIIQDADLEYSPEEYPAMIELILRGKADIVFDSRFGGNSPHRVVYYWHRVGNKLITTLSNMFTHIDLTDIRLLQNIPPRNYSVYQHRGKTLWLRAGNNGENN